MRNGFIARSKQKAIDLWHWWDDLFDHTESAIIVGVIMLALIFACIFLLVLIARFG